MLFHRSTLKSHTCSHTRAHTQTHERARSPINPLIPMIYASTLCGWCFVYFTFHCLVCRHYKDFSHKFSTHTQTHKAYIPRADFGIRVSECKQVKTFIFPMLLNDVSCRGIMHLLCLLLNLSLYLKWSSSWFVCSNIGIITFKYEKLLHAVYACNQICVYLLARLRACKLVRHEHDVTPLEFISLFRNKFFLWCSSAKS